MLPSTVLALSETDLKAIYQDSVHYKIPAAVVCGQAGVTLSGSGNTEKIMNFLTSQGLETHQAAGVVGNLLGESSALPTRKQGNPPSYIATIEDLKEGIRLNKADSTKGFGIGIAQWTSWGRQQGLLDSAAGGDPMTLEVQLPFLFKELPANGLDELKKATDLRQATWIFLAFFERPGTVVDAGLARNPNQPTSGPAKDTLDTRVDLANGVISGVSVESGFNTDNPGQSVECAGDDSAEQSGKTPKILAIGDSMTARNVDESAHGKGWWGYLRDDSGVEVGLSAQGGSGYIRKGNHNGPCGGTTFKERLDDVKQESPTFIIVAGGYNDGSYCENGEGKPASDAQIQAGISSYIDDLAKQADELGIPHDTIYFWTPWGPNAEAKRRRIEPVIKENALRIGAKYVMVPSLSPNQSYDGTHPKAEGSKFFYDNLIANSDLKQKLAAAVEAAAASSRTPNFAANLNVKVDEPPSGAFTESLCTGTFTVGAASLKKFVEDKWKPPVTSVGGYSCRQNTASPGVSVHGVGRALDIMISADNPQTQKVGDTIRNYMINNATKYGVQRVIWNHHIWSANKDGWRDYDGPNPHTDHLHVEINLKASRNANLGG